MKNNRVRLLVFIVLIAMFPIGCATAPKMHSTALVCDENTPDGETCLMQVEGQFKFDGTKKFTVFATKVQGEKECVVKDANGNQRIVKCPTSIVGVFSEDDRIKSLTDPVLGLAGVAIQGEYAVKAAKAHAKNIGPSQVFVLAPSGGDASAGAVNNTEIGIQQEDTCPTGDCYLPD